MKGRIVYRGDCAKDEHGAAAVYQELGANPTSVQGLNACLAYGTLPGHCSTAADAVKAYAATILENAPWEVSAELLDELKIEKVLGGSVTKTEDDCTGGSPKSPNKNRSDVPEIPDPYAECKRLGVFEEVPSLNASTEHDEWMRKVMKIAFSNVDASIDWRILAAWRSECCWCPTSDHIRPSISGTPLKAMAPNGKQTMSSVLQMRNFPKAWMANTGEDIEAKLRKLLSTFGDLTGLQVNAEPGEATTAKAAFAEPAMAEKAVKALHGVDMRTAKQKREAGNQPPAEDEKFWAQIVPPASAQPAPAPSQEPVASQETYLLVEGFPTSWSEAQLRATFLAFGGVERLTYVPDSRYGRIAKIVLKDSAKMEQVVKELHGSKVGDGDVVEECVLNCKITSAAVQKKEEEARKKREEKEARKLYRADVRKRREEARKEKERLDKESKEPNHEEAPDEEPEEPVEPVEPKAKRRGAAKKAAARFEEEEREDLRRREEEEAARAAAAEAEAEQRRKEDEAKAEAKKAAAAAAYQEELRRRAKEAAEKREKEQQEREAERQRREEKRRLFEQDRMKREEERQRREEKRRKAEEERLQKEEEERQRKAQERAEAERKREEERQRKEEKMRRYEESRMRREEVRTRNEIQRELWEATRENILSMEEDRNELKKMIDECKKLATKKVFLDGEAQIQHAVMQVIAQFGGSEQCQAFLKRLEADQAAIDRIEKDIKKAQKDWIDINGKVQALQVKSVFLENMSEEHQASLKELARRAEELDNEATAKAKEAALLGLQDSGCFGSVFGGGGKKQWRKERLKELKELAKEEKEKKGDQEQVAEGAVEKAATIKGELTTAGKELEAEQKTLEDLAKKLEEAKKQLQETTDLCKALSEQFGHLDLHQIPSLQNQLQEFPELLGAAGAQESGMFACMDGAMKKHKMFCVRFQHLLDEDDDCECKKLLGSLHGEIDAAIESSQFMTGKMESFAKEISERMKDECMKREEKLQRWVEEQMRIAAEKKRKQDEERRRKHEEEMRKWEEKRMRREEEIQRRAEKAMRLAQEKRRQREEEKARLREEEKKRREEEMRRYEESRMRREEELLKWYIKVLQAREAAEERKRGREEERKRKEEKMRRWEEDRMAREEFTLCFFIPSLGILAGQEDPRLQQTDRRAREEEKQRKEEERRMKRQRVEPGGWQASDVALWAAQEDDTQAVATARPKQRAKAKEPSPELEDDETELDRLGWKMWVTCMSSKDRSKEHLVRELREIKVQLTELLERVSDLEASLSVPSEALVGEGSWELIEAEA
eukprot:s2191_g1.t1